MDNPVGSVIVDSGGVLYHPAPILQMCTISRLHTPLTDAAGSVVQVESSAHSSVWPLLMAHPKLSYKELLTQLSDRPARGAHSVRQVLQAYRGVRWLGIVVSEPKPAVPTVRAMGQDPRVLLIAWSPVSKRE